MTDGLTDVGNYREASLKKKCINLQISYFDTKNKILLFKVLQTNYLISF